MKAHPTLLALLLAMLAIGPLAAQEPVAPRLRVEAPASVLSGNPFAISIQVPEGLAGTPYGIQSATGEELRTGTFEAGENRIEEIILTSRAQLPLTITGPGLAAPVALRLLPGWLALVPPLLAIALALLFREVVVSLFAGIWLGAFFLAGMNPLAATLSSVDRFALGALADDADRVAIAMFSLLLGGMVGVMTRSGGTLGIVEALRPLATSPRRGQLMTWFAGMVIFFDDYANTLIVGNTMRPVTDRLNISREKLAYIVDSTAAPMAAIALVSTWVGFEISLIGSALESAAMQTSDPLVQANLLAGAANPFNIFLHSIPYLFYPILTLIFVLIVALTRRDFGPMLAAEQRAARGEGVIREGAVPVADPSAMLASPADRSGSRWYNAALPITAVVAAAIAGIFATGRAALPAGEHALWDIIGAGDPFRALLWASFLGCVVAIALAVGGRALRLGEAIDAWVGGLRSMLLAIVILVLAWGLGGVTEALGTGSYLADLLGSALPVRLLPVLVFVIAAATSFATGTSWGTMAILFPVVVPLAVAMGAGVGFDAENYTILLGAISSVMAGSLFGDHCSPISDTTVMSSMASACDHIDHVRTQLPYALLVALVAMLIGDLPTAFGMSPFLSLALGITILYLVLRFFGQRSDVREVVPSPSGEGEVSVVVEQG